MEYNESMEAALRRFGSNLACRWLLIALVVANPMIGWRSCCCASQSPIQEAGPVHTVSVEQPSPPDTPSRPKCPKCVVSQANTSSGQSTSPCDLDQTGGRCHCERTFAPEIATARMVSEPQDASSLEMSIPIGYAVSMPWMRSILAPSNTLFLFDGSSWQARACIWRL